MMALKEMLGDFAAYMCTELGNHSFSRYMSADSNQERSSMKIPGCRPHLR